MDDKNYYPVDPNASVEASRLLRQDRLLTELTGLFPGHLESATLQSVLDIGCGPGGWLVEVARRFPHLHLVGLDSSGELLQQARAIAAVEQLTHLQFMHASFTHLPCADQSFDMLNARLVQWFVDQHDRDTILQEWYRVLRPGGWLRFIEAEAAQTNSPATEAVSSLFLHLLQQEGKSVLRPPDQELLAIVGPHYAQPRAHGIVLTLPGMLKQLGCEDIHVRTHVLDCSADAPAHDAFVQNMLLAQQSFREVFLAHFPDLTPERLDRLYALRAQEMQSPDFLGLEFFLEVSGRKPSR